MRIQHYLILALFAVLVLFLVQNAEAVTLRLLFWQVTVSRSLMVLIVFAGGVLVGWIASTLRAHRNARH